MTATSLAHEPTASIAKATVLAETNPVRKPMAYAEVTSARHNPTASAVKAIAAPTKASHVPKVMPRSTIAATKLVALARRTTDPATKLVALDLRAMISIQA